MDEVIGKSLLILGRQPELGLAELESLYGAENILPLRENVCLLSTKPADINFGRLGGSLKLAQVIDILPATDWPQAQDWVVKHLRQNLPAGKLSLGVSIYGLDVASDEINRSLLAVKKAVRTATGKSIRVVPNQQGWLSSAQVLHNKLTSASGREFVLVKHGAKLIISQTIAEQDIEAYAARDQARPKRDATVGMLPPKLAQIIVNLANPPAESTILDPFCGTGVILQEALLMGYGAYGSDTEPRMVDYSSTNLGWLRDKRPNLQGFLSLDTADATKYQWEDKFQAVASETYLGRALSSVPDPAKLQTIVHDVNTILSKFLKNINPQLKPGTRLSLAVPAWRSGQGFILLPLIEHLTDMGYNLVEFSKVSQPLIYWREGQVVGRHLLLITKV